MKLCKKQSQFRTRKQGRSSIALVSCFLIVIALSVQSFATPISTPFLSVDLNGAMGATAGGWDGWDFPSDPAGSANVEYSQTFGAVTVGITAITTAGGNAFNSRDRGSSVDPLDDFVYAGRDTSLGLGAHLLQLNFSGLDPDTTYEVTFLGQDAYNTGSVSYMAVDVRDPTDYSSYQPAAGGTNNPFYGTLLGRFAISGATPPADIYDYSSSFFVTTDSSGNVTIYTWNDSESWSGSQLVSMLSAFEIGEITAFVWSGGTSNIWSADGNWLGGTAPITDISGPIYIGSNDTGDRVITGVDDDHTNVVSINFSGAGGNFTISGTGSFSIVSAGTVGNGTGGRTHTIDVGLVSNGAGMIFNGLDNIIVDGDISGSGGITKTSSTTLTLNGTNTYDGDTLLSEGTLIVNGSIAGSGTTNVNGGYLMGTGTIATNVNINNGGTFRPGNSIGTMTIDGDYVQDAGSVLEVEVLNDNGVLTSDLLDITGTATLELNSTINVVDLSSNGAITTGDEFTIITAAGGITDNGVLLIDSSVYVDFAGSIVGNDYILTADTRDVYSDNNRSLLDALGSDMGTATGDYLTMINALNGLGSGALNTAAEALSPLSHASVRGFNSQMADDLIYDLTSYLGARRHGTEYMAKFDVLRRSELLLADASGNPELLTQVVGETERLRQQLEDADKEIHTFFRPFGIWTDQSSTDEFTGYQAQSYGVQFGADRIFRGNWILGLGGSYSHSCLDFDHGHGEAEIDSFRVGPYASYFVDRWFVDSSLTVGYHLNDTARDIQALNRTADGDYYAWDVSAYVGGGYEFDFKNWTIAPSASVRYSRYRNEAFEETGGGPANLDVEAETQESLLSNLGVRIYTVTMWQDMKISPELFAGYSHEFMDDENIAARFVSGTSKFTTDVDSERENSFYYGAGLSGLIGDRTSAFIRYEYETYSGNDTTTLKAGLTFIF